MHYQAFLMTNYTPLKKQQEQQQKTPNSLLHIEGGGEIQFNKYKATKLYFL